MNSKDLDFSQIHLWLADLTALLRQRDWVWQHLDNTERLRWQNCKVPEAGARFAACRAFVREILARYVCTDHKSQLRFTAQGQPTLPGFFLSWSRSEGQAVLAITQACPIGVDLEDLSHFLQWQEFLPFFEPKEVHSLRELAKHKRHEACAILWVRKEAVLKACGLGLAALKAVSASPRLEDWRLTLTLSESFPRSWFCPVFRKQGSVVGLAYAKEDAALAIVEHDVPFS
ncbi:MAG: 4'-phosphopantetheinyl transferase superfamily protein [Desulfovibrio sp.]|nr:4'-phosphopantetheinyl transferase superfamily protein [Desulfovibrio sp.]